MSHFLQINLNTGMDYGLWRYSTNGGCDEEVGYGGPEYSHQCSPRDGHCWILGKKKDMMNSRNRIAINCPCGETGLQQITCTFHLLDNITNMRNSC